MNYAISEGISVYLGLKHIEKGCFDTVACVKKNSIYGMKLENPGNSFIYPS